MKLGSLVFSTIVPLNQPIISAKASDSGTAMCSVSPAPPSSPTSFDSRITSIAVAPGHRSRREVELAADHQQRDGDGHDPQTRRPRRGSWPCRRPSRTRRRRPRRRPTPRSCRRARRSPGARARAGSARGSRAARRRRDGAGCVPPAVARLSPWSSRPPTDRADRRAVGPPVRCCHDCRPVSGSRLRPARPRLRRSRRRRSPGPVRIGRPPPAVFRLVACRYISTTGR